MLAGHVQEMALVETYEDGGNIRVRDSLRITPRGVGPLGYQSLDAGTPAVRAASTPMPDNDGTIDTTRYSDAKAVSLSLIVWDGAFAGQSQLVLPPDATYTLDDLNYSAYWVDLLSSWMAPERRNMRLYITYTGQSRSRYMNIRPAAMSAPIVMAERQSRQVQMQWVVPDGRSYAFDNRPPATASNEGSTIDGRSRSAAIGQGTAQVPGVAFPLDFSAGLAFPGVPLGTGNKDVVSRGVAATGFAAQINAGGALGDASSNFVGPGIVISHQDSAGLKDYPDQVVSLSSYTLQAGTFLTIDTRTREIFLGYDRTNRLDGYLGNVTWPVLRRGRNTIALTGTGGSSPNVVITWADAFLL